MTLATIRHLRSALLLLLLPAAHAAPPGSGKSVFWEPYTYDGDTRVLCHFDGEELISTAEVLELEEEDDGEPEDLMSGPAPGSEGPRTINSMPIKNAYVPLLGNCKELKGVGRFGGGLRLTGKDGRLTVQAGAGRGWALEAWFRPARLPDTRTTLFDLPHGVPMRLSLLADGRLQVQWLRQREPLLSEWRAHAETWFHLALVWRPTSFHVHNVTRGGMVVFLNGNPVLRSGEESAAAFSHTVSGEVTVANDARGGSGFDGWLDELRLSSAARAYYALDLDWVDTAGERPAPTGRPYFRDDHDLLFWAKFDGTLAPTVAEKSVSLVEGTPPDAEELERDPKDWGFRFGEGVSKQALLLRPGKKHVRYRGLTTSVNQGTIAFWCRPQDWDNETQWNPFAGWPQEFAPVFRHEFIRFDWLKTPDSNFYPNPVDLHPGRWMHLALTWEHGSLQAYLNGRRWAHWGTVQWHYKQYKEQPKDLALTLPVSQHATYVDDFRIYRRALAPSEVVNLAALYDRRAQIKPLPDFDYVKNVNGVLGTASLTLWPLIEDYARISAATLTVLGPSSETQIGQTRIEADPDRRLSLRVQTDPLGFGEYKLQAAALDNEDNEVKTLTLTHSRQKPPWWQSKVGLSDKVMQDWTPVKVAEKTLSVIGRGIRFGDSGLPESLVSAGKEILAAPITLTAAAGGKAQTLKPVTGSFKAEAKGEVRADFGGKCAGAGLTAAVQGTLEFDGFMWFEITLRPVAVDSNRQQSTAIESLNLTVPYEPDASRLLHAWNGNGWFRDPHNVRIMEVPEEAGPVFSSLDKRLIRIAGGLRGSFMPYVMLTGDKRGMAWFAENDRGWTQSTKTPGVAIERTEDAVVLTLNIISEPVELTKPRTFAFGLHPIPVKPLDPAWRSWEWWTVAPDHFCGFNLKSEQHGLHTGLQRVPDNLDWDAVKERFKRAWGKTGNQPRTVMVPGVYLNLRGLGEVAEDAREWAGDWYGHGWGKGGDTLRYTQEQIDYSAYYFNEWVRRGLCYGIYLDDAWNNAQRVVPGPAAYLLEDGHMQPGFEWRGQRQYLRRIRQIFYDHGLTPHMCVHLTHTQYPMWLSFFDEMYDGEDHDLRPAGHPTDFMHYWTPFRLRYHNSQKWGIAPYFHGWAGNNMKDKMGQMPTWCFKQERAYAAALMLHDLGWLNREAFRAALGKTWETWVKPSGMLSDPSIEFIPYWDPTSPAAHEHPDLYVSAWKREGWCGVVLVNYGKERVEAEVKLDPEAMGFGDASSEQVAIRHVDEHLLSYFDEDVTKLKAPDAEKIAETALLEAADPTEAGGMEAGADNEEDELDELGFKKKITPEMRKAADPDGKFEWKDGFLKCPVRPHDFRLFEFRAP